MPSVREQLDLVMGSIAKAASQAGRDADAITLVAVSKKQPAALMREYISAAKACGVRIVFGENYVQELKAKRADLGAVGEFHLLGPLQSNKIKDAVALADVIQSVHSLSVLEGIAKEAGRQGKIQSVFLQVNIGNDPAKSGFKVDELPLIFEKLPAFRDGVCVLGLMTITPYYEEASQARPDFAKMGELRTSLKQRGYAQLFSNSTILLSMGMSGDFNIAIEEGADLIRVGTALFGERQ
jgi:pyridoxal phosphate enzyme (YggS family)